MGFWILPVIAGCPQGGSWLYMGVSLPGGQPNNTINNPQSRKKKNNKLNQQIMRHLIHVSTPWQTDRRGASAWSPLCHPCWPKACLKDIKKNKILNFNLSFFSIQGYSKNDVLLFHWFVPRCIPSDLSWRPRALDTSTTTSGGCSSRKETSGKKSL